MILLYLLCLLSTVLAQDCSDLLSQTKPDQYLGYQCIADSTRDFTQDYVTQFKTIIIQDAINNVLPTQYVSRSDCAALVLNQGGDGYRIKIEIDKSQQNQYLSAIYISYELYYPSSSPYLINFFAGWGGNNYYQSSYQQDQITSNSLQEQCSQPQYQYVSNFANIPVQNQQPQITSALFTFESYQDPLTLGQIYLSNFKILFYYQCPIGCAGNCPGSVCSSCNTGYNLVGNSCQLQCLPGEYSVTDPDSSQQNCQPCISNCNQCSDSSTCNICKPGFGFAVVNGQIVNNQCQSCFSSCQTCADTNQSSCQSCATNYYALKNSQAQVQFQCVSICPNGYQQQDQTCLLTNQIVYNCLNKTCRSCSSAQSNTCIDCYPGIDLINGSCKCPQDPRNLNYYYCSDNNKIAVVQANFSNQNPTLTLEFGLNLSQIASIQCSEIFDSITLNLLGSSQCAINKSQVIVSLSQDAKIMANYTIGIDNNSKKLQFQGSQQVIDTIYFFSINQQPVSPQVNIKYDQIQNSCNDITFSIQSIQNDAGRGFFSIEWKLDQSQTFDQQTLQNLNTVIQNANKIQSQTLIIPKFTIPPNSSITVQLSYMLKVYSSNTFSFTTLNQKNKLISISSIQNQYSPLYRYMGLSIQFLIFTQECGTSGQITTQDFYDIQLTSQALPSLNKDLTQFNSSVMYLDVAPYLIPVNTVLDILVQVNISGNQAVNSKYTLSITYKLSNLQVFLLNGANNLVDYKSKVTLSASARDFEVQDLNSPQGISTSWTCQSLQQQNGDNKCYTYLKTIFDVPQNVLSFTIQEGTFNPYQTLNFTVVGSKVSRTAQATTILIFAEIDLPPLLVQFDDPTLIQSVNINEDISATLIYGSNIPSDILTYAGAILYNNKVVGVIKFDFYKVKFRIWDYFSNINPNNPVVQVRFTVYNPANIMPSLSVTNFNINIPPQNCILNINPQSGQALSTQFSIQLIGCSTNNYPLTYQFFYYNQDSDLKQEILIPQNILRRQLQDQSVFNSVTTFLPSGNILIMAQAMDSYLAVFNTTLQVNISPYQQSEKDLQSLIDQALSFQNSNLNINTIVKNLCIIGEELAKNIALYNLDSVNQRKIPLIQAIISQTNSLPVSSFLSTYSNKIVATLQASLSSQQNLQSQNVLNQVSLILQNQQQLIANINPNNKIQNNNDIILQNLVDSFKIVNSTTQSISQILQQLSNSNGNRILNSFNQFEQQQKLETLRALASSYSQEVLQQQMNVTDQIGNLLNNITLPNSGKFELQGNLISLNAEQITSKNLQNYMYMINKPLKNDSSIYNVVITNYTSNPFIQTTGFQQYINQISNSTPGIHISLNPVIKPSIQSANNALKPSFNNQLQLEFLNIKPSKYNLTCLQQQSDQNWLQSKCSLVNSSLSGAYTCFCSDQRPTTIVEDLQQLLDNKNLKTAFGSQGIENISSFTTFYEYVVFWILAFVTFLQIGLCYYGRSLDSKFGMSSMSTISPLSSINIAQAEQSINMQEQQTLSPIKAKRRSRGSKTQQNQEQIPIPIQQDINGQSYRWMQSNIQLNGQLQITQLSKLSFQPSQDIQQNQISKVKQSNDEVNNNQSIMNLCMNQNDEKKSPSIIQEEEISKKSKEGQINSNEFQIQQKGEEQQNNINIIKESQNTQKILSSSMLKKILIFHSFSSIFYVYDSKQSRAFRFVIFYLRVIHSLSISIIFDQKYNQEQVIMVSCINSVIIIVSVAIISLVYKFRKIGKIIASLLILGLLALYYYIILSIVSGQSPEQSNKKIYSFLIMFGIDFLFISTILSLFSIFIFIQSAQTSVLSQFMLKLINFLQIQHILQNIRL